VNMPSVVVILARIVSFLLWGALSLSAAGCMVDAGAMEGAAPEEELGFAEQALGAPVVSVDTAGCLMNVAINNAIGQSFKIPSASKLDSIDIWIKPNLYYTTSYNVELYDGEGTSGTKLATSASLTMGSQTGGVPSGWYKFTFAGPELQANHAYTLRLVRLSQYSGAFSECGDVYGNGIEYWLGYWADSSYDISFRVYTTTLSHRFPLDEASGGASVFDAVGAVTGSLGTSASLDGSAVTLTPSFAHDLTSYVDFGAAIGQLGTSDFTIAHRYKTTFATAGVLGDILGNRADPGHGNFMSVRVNGSGHISLEIDEDAAGTGYVGISTSSYPLNNGAWHHLAYVRQGATVKLYVDGVLAASGSTASGQPTNLTSATSYRIGRRIGSCCGEWRTTYRTIPGSYDDLRFYSSALSDADIAELAAQ
jgi:hypothetical protein